MKRLGGSILVCQACGMSLANIGSKVERIHPVARFFEHHTAVKILAWCFISLSLFLLLAYVNVFDRMHPLIAELTWFITFLVPILILYFIRSLIPLYRIKDCPFCGHHEKHKLGISPFG